MTFDPAEAKRSESRRFISRAKGKAEGLAREVRVLALSQGGTGKGDLPGV